MNSDLPIVPELVDELKEMNNKIQDIIDNFFKATGKFVTIQETINSKKDIRSDFTIHGGPKPETGCRLKLCSNLQKRIDQEIDRYNRGNLKPLNKRRSNHDEFYTREIKEAEYHLEMAKELFIDIKKYINNKDENDYIDISFGDIKSSIDAINKSKGYETYQYFWPDKIYLLGGYMGSAGGRMMHQIIDIEFI